VAWSWGHCASFSFAVQRPYLVNIEKSISVGMQKPFFCGMWLASIWNYFLLCDVVIATSDGTSGSDNVEQDVEYFLSSMTRDVTRDICPNDFTAVTSESECRSYANGQNKRFRSEFSSSRGCCLYRTREEDFYVGQETCAELAVIGAPSLLAHERVVCWRVITGYNLQSVAQEEVGHICENDFTAVTSEPECRSYANGQNKRFREDLSARSGNGCCLYRTREEDFYVGQESCADLGRIVAPSVLENERVVCRRDYVTLRSGETQCPNGFAFATTRDDCRNYAHTAGSFFNDPYTQRRLQGCCVFDDRNSGEYYLHADDCASLVSYDRLCMTDHILINAIGCPGNFALVTEEDDCRSYANGIGKRFEVTKARQGCCIYHASAREDTFLMVPASACASTMQLRDHQGLCRREHALVTGVGCAANIEIPCPSEFEPVRTEAVCRSYASRVGSRMSADSLSSGCCIFWWIRGNFQIVHESTVNTIDPRPSYFHVCRRRPTTGAVTQYTLFDGVGCPSSYEAVTTDTDCRNYANNERIAFNDNIGEKTGCCVHRINYNDLYVEASSKCFDALEQTTTRLLCRTATSQCAPNKNSTLINTTTASSELINPVTTTKRLMPTKGPKVGDYAVSTAVVSSLLLAVSIGMILI